MKTPLLLLTLVFAAAGSTMAQVRGVYQFDNFDIANGIRIQQPSQKEALKSSRRKGIANWSKGAAGSSSPNTLIALTSMSVGRSLDGFTTGSAEVDSFIVESGARHGVDPVLLYAIMHQESTFKAKAVSPKGARGLMQLMPGTAARYGVTNIFDPRQNIDGGARYMKFLLNLFDGDVNLALAGYNAGEGAVMKYGYRVPPYSETQEYVRRISRRYALMRDPLTARNANSLSQAQVAVVRTKESTPLSVYEPNVYAVRLPDGRLQLMSQ
ncbi:MAG: Lytic transglycosylase catalytic [Acidobacteria bacterium]|nr:Lytic transglycosylase catalytic [Acidobacteriota bacterium]